MVVWCTAPVPRPQRVAETRWNGRHAGSGVISAACVATAPECSGEQVIRVLVAEDTRAVRDTLTALLDLEPDIEVAGAVASGDQVVPAALAHRPDVALLDIGLPGTDGIAAAGDVARRVPGCRVLILTGL